MKTVTALLLCLILAVPSSVFAQDVIAGKELKLHGTIRDKENEQPLGYTSIGVLNKPSGTVSDSTGNFELVVDEAYPNDTLQISMVGYYPVKKLIRDLIKENVPVVITLEKKVTTLNEVAVSGRMLNTIVVGRTSSGGLLKASIIPKGEKAPTIGAESGLKIAAKKYPAFLENFNFYLSWNNFKFIKFRLNIYSLKNNLPDTLLFNREILVSLNNYKTGWTQVGLSSYHFVIKNDCAVTLQWVDYNKDIVEAPKVLVPVGISFSHINYYRTASQDKWKSIKGNSSVYVTLRN
ncbi:MAG: carboxypeptidase-like regulatory domain-containing protein [Mucilaginibacter sp.]